MHPTIEELFDVIPLEERKEVTGQIIGNVNDLLSVGLEFDGEDKKYSSLVDSLTWELMGESSFVDEPLLSFFEGSFENVLNEFVKRNIEIGLNGDLKETYFDDVNKVLAYALRVKKLDGVLNELTREYCATECDTLPVGCCSMSFYNLGMPEVSLKAQELEAKKNDWVENDKDTCKYHTDKGCALTLLKSPLCMTFFCNPLKNYLRETFGVKESRKFIRLSETISLRLKENTFYFLRELDKVIVEGDRLVEIKYGGIEKK